MWLNYARMRSRAVFPAIIGCLGVLLLPGCGDRSPGLRRHTGDIETTRVVFDLVERVRSAEIVRGEAFIDVGAASSSGSLRKGWSDSEIDPGSGASFAWAIADRAVLETTVLDPEIRHLEMRCRPFQWESSP